MVKYIGLKLLFSLLAGDAVMLSKLAKTALSSVFDRRQETEADTYAFELMVKSELGPTSMASFFRRVKRELGGYDENLKILMSHPHDNARIKASIEFELPENFSPKKFDLDWTRVKNSLDGGESLEF